MLQFEYSQYLKFDKKNEYFLGVGWSGPPSFMSSSGPSSPGASENSKESSEMSSSIISADGYKNIYNK